MIVRHAIRRNSSTTVLPFSTITEKFLAAQEGRGNSPHTIKHYQGSIKKLQLFLCWLSDESNAYPLLSDTERLNIGAAAPIALFQRDDFDRQLRLLKPET